jgi:diguanylate cyclase (GGDEF)-like protein
MPAAGAGRPAQTGGGVEPEGTARTRWGDRLLVRLRGLLHSPDGLVEQTRRLFAVSVVLSMLSVLPKPLLTMPAGLRVVAGLAVLVAVAGWARRYRTRSAPLGADLVEVAALAALVVAFPVAVTIYVFAFAAVWFRALYGPPARAVLYCALVSVGVLAAVPFWARAHSGDPIGQLISMSVPLPALWLTMLVARALARSLFAREQSRRRDAALVELGHRLIGRTERDAIHTDGRRCLVALCAATPGLRAVVVRAGRDGPAVVDHAGWTDPPPAALSRLIAQTSSPRGLDPVAVDGLRALFGPRTGWSGVALPCEPGGWVLLGAPGAVPGEALIAVQSLVNQVALALRTSAAHHELTSRALVDPLTGLANRAAFTAALERQHGTALPFAVLFLDLDDFKTVNDRMGHAAGDELLRQVAARLRAGLRTRDVCARLGGDEFAVLLPDSGDTAHSIAQRLVEQVCAPVPLAGRTVRVAASVGLAFGSAELTAGELVQRADTAMYAAKARGKNRVEAFHPGLLGGTGPEPFEAELAAAAAAGQLVVHYQPIVSVPDEQCVAVEALVRWQHPSRGLLAPAEFVPAAERTGDIVAIGAHVLRRACAEAAGWAGPDGPLALHVNVSAAQLGDAGFREVVRACLADADRGGGRLVLEITESAVLDSPDIGPALDELIRLGALIAIDDFGTGYSALTTLRTLPLDIVKIDRSFLAGYPERAADGVAVEAIVELAGRLGLRIVVEGVERADQQLFLRRVGADAAQGYLHLRPVPAAEFAGWLVGRASAGPAARIEAVAAPAPRGELRIDAAPRAGRRRTG